MTPILLCWHLQLRSGEVVTPTCDTCTELLTFHIDTRPVLTYCHVLLTAVMMDWHLRMTALVTFDISHWHLYQVVTCQSDVCSDVLTSPTDTCSKVVTSQSDVCSDMLTSPIDTYIRWWHLIMMSVVICWLLPLTHVLRWWHLTLMPVVRFDISHWHL